MRRKYAEATKARIIARDMAQELAAGTGSIDDWNDYKTKRSEVKSLLKKEKLAWQRSKLEACEEVQDTGKLWKTMRGWLNWSSTPSPTKLINERRFVSSPGRIANIQNEYYNNKVHTIRQELPQSRADPLATLRERLHGNSSTFNFSAVTPDEVEKIISSLK